MDTCRIRDKAEQRQRQRQRQEFGGLTPIHSGTQFSSLGKRGETRLGVRAVAPNQPLLVLSATDRAQVRGRRRRRGPLLRRCVGSPECLTIPHNATCTTIASAKYRWQCGPRWAMLLVQVGVYTNIMAALFATFKWNSGIICLKVPVASVL